MNDDQTPQPTSGLTRRNALIGAAAAAGAVAVVSASPFKAGASSLEAILAQESVADLGPNIPGLTYLGIDGQTFWPDVAANRIWANNTGSQSNSGDTRVWAGLPIPAGSVIHQLHVSYQGTPTAQIAKRSIATPGGAPGAPYTKQLAAGGGPKAVTEVVSPAVTLTADSTYTLSFLTGPGNSVMGVIVGYLPPTQGFVPFAGTPRVLDTRGGAKLAPGAEITVDLEMPGARSAVLNVTVTQTDLAGYVAVFPADIAWPGNSSVNWSAPNQNVANGVITKVDPTGKIKIRGGDAATHVIVDRIGYMI